MYKKGRGGDNRPTQPLLADSRAVRVLRFFLGAFLHPLLLGQNPLAQPDVFGSDFYQLIVADKLQRILLTHTAGRR